MKLVIDNVSKSFKNKHALQNFTAELTNGVYGLLGPNGSGKSTLMRILADISKPTSGRVLLNDTDISLMGDDYREIIGYLPQDFGVYKHFTATRFLQYFASLKGLDRTYTKNKINEVLELVNLTEHKKQRVGTFSGGMKRRLGIAQALLNDPKILIVDEPTAGLDPQERVRFRNLLSEISSDRIVLISTHIVSDIEYIAKEILLLKEGILLQQSSLEWLLLNVQGKVWTISVQENELATIQKQFKVGNIQRGANGIQCRVVHNGKPLPSAQKVPATLEDVYLYYFDDEVTADV